MGIGPLRGQFAPFNFRTAGVPAGETGPPPADAQPSQDQASTNRFEAKLGRLAGNGWADKRGHYGRQAQTNLETETEDRTSESGQPPFEPITGRWFWARALFLGKLVYCVYHSQTCG